MGDVFHGRTGSRCAKYESDLHAPIDLAGQDHYVRPRALQQLDRYGQAFDKHEQQEKQEAGVIDGGVAASQTVKGLQPDQQAVVGALLCPEALL
jgi:hypothetical protein